MTKYQESANNANCVQRLISVAMNLSNDINEASKLRDLLFEAMEEASRLELKSIEDLEATLENLTEETKKESFYLESNDDCQGEV